MGFKHSKIILQGKTYDARIDMEYTYAFYYMQLKYILVSNIYSDYKYITKSDVFLIWKYVKYHIAKEVTNVKRNYSSRL
jgi:hypothetical protein